MMRMIEEQQCDQDAARDQRSCRHNCPAFMHSSRLSTAPSLRRWGVRNSPMRMPRPASLHVSLLLLTLITALLVSCSDHSSATPVSLPVSTSAKEPTTQLVVINHLKFHMELALSPAQRTQGLSDRTSIDEHGGMLFVFPKPESVRFVMRRCLVPIDIIFAREDGTITAMYEMQVEPYDIDEDELKLYPSHEPILFALEFKAGTLARLGLKLGDKLSLPFPDLKARAR